MMKNIHELWWILALNVNPENKIWNGKTQKENIKKKYKKEEEQEEEREKGYKSFSVKTVYIYINI